MSKINYEYIINLIKSDKIKKAISEIDIIVQKISDKEIQNQFILACNRWKKEEKSFLNGLSVDKSESNRVIYSFIDLVQEIQEIEKTNKLNDDFNNVDLFTNIVNETINLDVAINEIYRLNKELKRLEEELNKIHTSPIVDISRLNKGSETFLVQYEVVRSHYIDDFDESEDEYNEERECALKDIVHQNKTVTWNEIFYVISPYLIDGEKEIDLKVLLSQYLSKSNQIEINQLIHYHISIDRVTIFEDDFQTIKVQLLALNLIRISKRKFENNEFFTEWNLTIYGIKEMMKLRAVYKK